MSFLLKPLLLVLLLLVPCTAAAQTLEERRAELVEARNSIHDKLNALPFNKLRLDASSLASDAFAAEEVRLDEPDPILFGYTSRANNKFEVFGQYAGPDSLVETYLSAFLARYEPQVAPEKLVIIPPFTLPFEHELEVTGVSFGAAYVEAAPFWPEQDQWTGLQVRPGPLGLDVSYPDERPLELPDIAHVRVAFEQPNSLLSYEFTELEPGLEIAVDPYIVTINTRDEVYLEFSIRRLDGDPVDRRSIRIDIEATDVEGQGVRAYRSNTSHVEDPSTRWAIISDLLTRLEMNEIDDKQAQRELGSIKTDASHQLFVRASFVTAPAGAVVYVRGVADTQATEHTIAIPVTDFSQFERTSDLVSSPTMSIAPVFAQELSIINDAVPDTLSQNDVADQLAVHASGEAVRFQLPPTVSDVLFQHRSLRRFDIVEPVTFLNASGQVIAVEPPYRRPPDLDSPYAYVFRRDKLALRLEEFPERPVRAIGTIVLSLLPDMQRARYDLEDLPIGIQVAGNKLIVGGVLRRNSVRVLALDDVGRPLKPFYQTEGGGRGLLGLTATHFYGSIDAVEVFIAGPVQKVEVDFDVILPN